MRVPTDFVFVLATLLDLDEEAAHGVMIFVAAEELNLTELREEDDRFMSVHMAEEEDLTP